MPMSLNACAYAFIPLAPSRARAFAPSGSTASASSTSKCGRRPVCMCEPTPPRDPGDLRDESSRRRNQPVKPLRRRRRLRNSERDNTDWERMESIPLVRPDTSPESGEDYWVDLGAKEAQKPAPPQPPKRGVNESMKERLRKETFAPYEQNWALWIIVSIAFIAILFKLAGGFDSIPIISVPDL